MTRAPFFDDIANGPAGGEAHWLTTADRLKIRVAHWVVKGETLKGTILLFPGRTEYIEKYGPAAAEFLARGYAMVAIDWRGQGIADRTTNNPLLGDVVNFKDYQHDVAALLAHVETLDLPKPYFLVAHSMGGCIGLRAIYEGLPVTAAAFSAPMWGIYMAAPMRPFAWGITHLAKMLGFDKNLCPGQSRQSYVNHVKFADNTLSSDREEFDFMRNQIAAHPEVELGGPSLRWLGQALREMRHLSTIPSPEMPCVTFLGSDDEIVDSRAIQTRMVKWENGTLQHLKDARHEVMMETPAMRKQVFNAATALFDQHS